MSRHIRVHHGSTPPAPDGGEPRGRLTHALGDDFYVIDDAQALAPFLMSVVSDSDHWLFVASNGALTAGRGDPSRALFPYVTEDKLYDAAGIVGPATTVICERDGTTALWHPLRESDRLLYRTTRRLYKNVLGNHLVFEEDNHDLGLCFRTGWRTSERFGFVRDCTLVNRGATPVEVRILDGLLGLLPADVSEPLQLGYSCLVDAFKKHERVPGTTLALYTLAAQVVDRAEPVESLHATLAWSHGLDAPEVLLADDGRADFARGAELTGADEVRGRRGAYLLQSRLTLAPGGERGWVMVADVARSQPAVAELIAALARPDALVAEVRADVAAGRARLEQIVAATDGLQRTALADATAHHVANVLFNDQRGGVFAHGTGIPGPDVAAFVRGANRAVWSRHRALLDALPALEPRAAHQARLAACGDPDLTRLAAEYLPLTFSRRHGDPSRPWNRFAIRVRDERGEQILDYQGNWRDIFQNWEALARSSPGFVEQLVTKFVNASTVDGHNPYRIGRAGIDWEVPDPDHPWATIGYWGDHQIVYLLRLLELSLDHHPDRLPALLEVAGFTYADVPYRLRPFAAMVADPRVTIDFDADRHATILARAARLGSDGRLVHDGDAIKRVTLVEKLLVPALAKLASFVPGGGIWMNTQRPEWNDANNALVGFGVSMVTACYLERYLVFLGGLLAPLGGRTTPLSREVARWLDDTLGALDGERALLDQPAIDDGARWRVMEALGTTASAYRARVDAGGVGEPVAAAGDRVLALLALALGFLRHTLARARRDDDLFHSYGVLVPAVSGPGFAVTPLAEMLEGQVAGLATTTLDDEGALALLDALRASRLYRPDQESYLLYPDRRLPRFLDKNVIPPEALARAPLLARLLAAGDDRLVLRDVDGRHRFHGSLTSAAVLSARVRALREAGELPGATDAELDQVLALYEDVFDHRSFTGRSGTMFAYEGLGSVYWHMVGKLLLAVQDRFFAAAERGADGALLARLAGHYEAIRAGMCGVEKSPARWGAFPLDPYSHTPAGGGARQPGMTGQVKEEILIRLGELGVRIRDGRVGFRPLLLRRRELLAAAEVFEPYAVDGRRLRLELPPGSLAFTLCQVPVIYRHGPHRRLRITERGGQLVELDGDTLDAERSAALFDRSGRVERIEVEIEPGR